MGLVEQVQVPRHMTVQHTKELHSRTLGLSHSPHSCALRTLAPSHSRTKTLSHSRTLALSHSRTLALSHSRTLALSHSQWQLRHFVRHHALQAHGVSPKNRNTHPASVMNRNGSGRCSVRRSISAVCITHHHLAQWTKTTGIPVQARSRNREMR
jgi:hypothetical protein